MSFSRKALEPCPFCGGGAALFASSDHSAAWEGGCGNDKCGVQPSVWELTESDAIAAWNRRASPADDERATRYAKELATALWRKCYKHEAPHWQPFDDLLGVLTQIDNMVAGLPASPAVKQTPCASPADVLIDAERLDWLEAWHDMPSGGKHYGDVGISLITRTSDGWSIDLEWIFPLSEHETLREAIDAAMKAKP